MEFLKRRSSKRFMLMAVVVVVFVLAGFYLPTIWPLDPLETNFSNALASPDAKHLFGTDHLGRDLLTRIVYGARTTLSMTFLLLAGIFTVGLTVGTVAGYFGGKIDSFLMRVTDVFLAFPGIVLAIAFVGILGAGLGNTIIALIISGWAKYARISRSLVLGVKEKEFIKMAYMGGAGSLAVMFRYILPNILSPLLVIAMMDIGVMMLEISSLSFLGLGAQPPMPEWVAILSEGRNYMQTAPWMMIFPGLAIFITVVLFNILGDRFRDALDIHGEEKKEEKNG
ncbi:MAG TPA: nickel ABC transporter permease subunit NikC [Eubacteriaceae bacterium]|nr:nickel ABC transporter permease subunit NikC [Eubacteriaceae bacterium]